MCFLNRTYHVLTTSLFGLLALGDVSRYLGRADDLTDLVFDGRDGQGDVQPLS